jgi:hypothetical protein
MRPLEIRFARTGPKLLTLLNKLAQDLSEAAEEEDVGLAGCQVCRASWPC